TKPACSACRRASFSAEDVGFEPTRLSPAGFQDRCTRPLCESSVGEVTRGEGVFKNEVGLGRQIEQGLDGDGDAIFLAWAGNALCILRAIGVAAGHRIGTTAPGQH
ncbi:MAG: hypothetical protein RJA33_1357, partial [Actinomycetota bacterium]